MFIEETLEKLAKKVDASLVKQREGVAGMTLDYIPGYTVIRLLNSVFGYDGWSWTAETRTNVVGDRMVVISEGQLTVGNTVRNGVGVADGPISKGNAELVVKTAATDALKRAAITFGDAFGLNLYDKDDNHRLEYSDAGYKPSTPQQTASTPVSDGNHVCEEDGCGAPLIGYVPKSGKRKGMEVTPAMLAKDGQTYFQKTLCISHYRAYWDARNAQSGGRNLN